MTSCSDTLELFSLPFCISVGGQLTNVSSNFMDLPLKMCALIYKPGHSGCSLQQRCLLYTNVGLFYAICT